MNFSKRAQEAATMEPTFKVATQIGWFDDVFVTPSGVYPRAAIAVKGMPKGWSKIQVHLDAKDDDVHSRFRCYGSPLTSKEIFRLCKGNSRLMFAAALSFVGPICKPFGLRAPGFQAVGDPPAARPCSASSPARPGVVIRTALSVSARRGTARRTVWRNIAPPIITR